MHVYRCLLTLRTVLPRSIFEFEHLYLHSVWIELLEVEHSISTSGKSDEKR